MAENSDAPNVIVHPPIALALALAAAWVLDWLHPLSFLPPAFPGVWVGVALAAAGLLLVRWALVSFRAARTNVLTSQPTTAIVEKGPYAFSRNPIYVGALLVMLGLAVSFDTVWILAMLVPMYLVMRFGVVGREETYLERKFGAPYLDYKSRVRRWL